ncbi:hypothetical protein B0O80DRAFT_451347 [Mortierella sp. GBAus27b]|nr:hypothetical protein B0O80DRAFT_451347 [Mortierella sp. GBAus27b]
MEDGNIHAQAWTVFKFVMLSLKQPKFVSASDWIAVGSLAFDNLQKTLSGQVYRGPAQRLIRNIVSTMNQLWEGGCITDTSLAIEKCLANVIHKSFDGGIPMDQEIENGASLHMVQEFEQLIRGVANNIMPIPLPSIIWIHENSEICLDSMVLQFPGSLSGNVKLDYIELDKGTPRWRRQWHLKIDGLEIETKNVPYYFVAKTPLRLVDIGELSISMPSKSLEIEIKFIVTPPRIHYETKSSDPTTSVTTTATDASAPGWGEVDPSVTTTTTDSQVPQATGTPRSRPLRFRVYFRLSNDVDGFLLPIALYGVVHAVE